LCVYGLSLGLPTIIKAFGKSDSTVGTSSWSRRAVALTMAARVVARAGSATAQFLAGSMT
jgi:hypothetical protein